MKIEGFIISLNNKIYKKTKRSLSKKINISLKKFDAINGKLIDYSFYENSKNVSVRGLKSIIHDNIRQTHEDLGSYGAVGCYLSHLTLWHYILHNNLDGLFIFESDALCYPINKEIIYSFANINDADIILLGSFPLDAEYNTLEELDELDVMKNRFWGLHAYFITNKGAKYLTKHIGFPIEQQIDAAISDLIQLGNLNNSKYRPLKIYNFYYCYQKQRKSSIQTKNVRCE